MSIAFGDCILDLEGRELRRSGAVVPLSPLGLALLGALVEARPRAVPQQALRDRLWPDAFVGRTSLARLVTEIRKATGDTRREPRFVRTHHGFGYSFCAEARDVHAARRPAGCRLLWGAHEIPLDDGEHLIGRAPDCRVRVDTPKTSRHHARIVVSGLRAVVEDLGSKHGTYLGARRVDSPTPLGDGTQIGVGGAVLIFLSRGGTGSTETA